MLVGHPKMNFSHILWVTDVTLGHQIEREIIKLSLQIEKFVLLRYKRY